MIESLIWLKKVKLSHSPKDNEKIIRLQDVDCKHDKSLHKAVYRKA